jgi:hypothetical protein
MFAAMAKDADLRRLNVGALRRVAEWLDLQGRSSDDFDGWRKEHFVDWLAGKLARDQVDRLVACYDATDPYFDDRELAEILGLPQKERILELTSKDDLREAMERLDKQGKVQIFWKSLPADKLRDYLRAKLSKEEVAALLWDLGRKPGRSNGSSARPARSKERQENRIVAVPSSPPPAQGAEPEWDAVRRDLQALYRETDAWKRGKALEGVLNRLFKVAGIAVRDAFTVRGHAREGVVEQIDGVILLDAHFYLVETKWHADRLGVGDVSHHLVRLHARDGARGLLIAAHGFADPAVHAVREHLPKVTAILCDLDEIVLLLERRHDLLDFLRRKVEGAILHKNPLVRPLG